MKNENPVDHVSFYDKNLPNKGQYTHITCMFIYLFITLFHIYSLRIYSFQIREITSELPRSRKI